MSTFSGRWIGTPHPTFAFAQPRVVLAARPGRSSVAIQQALRRAGAIVEVVDAPAAGEGVVELQPDLVLIDVRATVHRVPPRPASDLGVTLDPLVDADADADATLIRDIQAACGPTSFVPVIALLDDAAAVTREQLLAVGADDVVRKPFDLVELFSRIDNLLGVRRQHVELAHRNADAVQCLTEVGVRLQALAQATAATPFAAEIHELVAELRSINEQLRTLVLDRA